MPKSAAEYREEIARIQQRMIESDMRSDPGDNFLSQWANDLSIRLCEAKARIVEDGMRSSFVGLYTIAGERVAARMVTSSFNGHTILSWILNDEAEAKYGRRFIPHNKVDKPGKIQKEKGLIERLECAPAWAKVEGSGTGMSGNAWVETYRTGDKWGMDATLIEDYDSV